MHFKRKAARAAAALFLASTFITPGFALSGTVSTDNALLRVRSEANTESEILKKLADGSQVEVLETLDGWYQVSYEDVTGYVMSKYLAVEGQAPVEGSDEQSDTEPVYVRVTDGPLNIRTGPGTDYDKAGRLYTGQMVEVLEILEGWYRIESGYISAGYAVKADPAESVPGQKIADYALQFLGCRYVYGGSSPSGFDCSGFTSYVYRQFGYSLNRTASNQMDNGVPVSKEELQPGDLVMFKEGGGSKRATHVAMYIGNGQIIHASTASVGVVISDLYSNYYVRTYVGARRIV